MREYPLPAGYQLQFVPNPSNRGGTFSENHTSTYPAVGGIGKRFFGKVWYPPEKKSRGDWTLRGDYFLARGVPNFRGDYFLARGDF